MAEQRQRFRFRLPWPAGPSAPRPAAPPQPPRPAPQTQAPPQRPPFRPAGIAPTPPPPPPPRPAVSQTRSASPSPSPSRKTNENRSTSAAPQPPPQAPPPPRPEGRTVSPSPAPSSSRKTNETRATSTAPQSWAASTLSSQSPAPPPQVQPASQPVPKPQSFSGSSSQSATNPSGAAGEKQLAEGTSKPLPPSSIELAPLPASQQVQSKPPQGFQPLSSQHQQGRSETPSGTVAKSGNQTSEETKSAQAVNPAKTAPKKPVASQKLGDGHISIDHSQFVSESKEKVVKKSVKEEKTEDQGNKQPFRKTITQLLTTASGSGTQTKELRTVTFQAEQKENKLETLDSTNTVASNSSNTKQVTETASSRFPKVRHTQTESHQDSITSNGEQERPPVHKEVRNDISKFVHKLAPAHIKESINEKEKPVSVITLAGDNRGASMQFGSDSAKKAGSVHIHRGYKMQPDESPETTTDGEESFKGRPKDHMPKEDQAMKAYVNNNVQSINNSIVFDCSVTERNPGVRLALSQSQAQPNKPTPPAEPPQASKVEFRVTPAEKRTYQPTIRRRCLRGLFMESSESEPDNPDKPRRHGCRYSCGEKGKDKDVGIL